MHTLVEDAHELLLAKYDVLIAVDEHGPPARAWRYDQR